jgi:hypothetical protein
LKFDLSQKYCGTFQLACIGAQVRIADGTVVTLKVNDVGIRNDLPSCLLSIAAEWSSAMSHAIAAAFGKPLYQTGTHPLR